MLPFWEILETQEEKDQILLLYECFKGPLYSVAFSMLKEDDKAEDMVQETFLVLMNNLDKIDAATYPFLEKYSEKKKWKKGLTLKEYSKQTENYIYAKALSYSITILKNKIYDSSKKATKEKVIFVEEYFDDIVGSEEMSPEYLLLQDEFLDVFKHTIKNLKYPYKDALYLRYFNNFSIEDIAQILEKNLDNVRKIISRARLMLKEQLAKEGYYV